MPNVCNWGILGGANIARKNWKAMRVAENANLVAVASRDAAKAQAFIDACQADASFAVKPEAIGSYEALLARSDIHAVYIPLPTGIRQEWVAKAAQAGKHILCEKPCAPTAAELKVMLEACTAHSVQFMDGVMFMHSARLPMLKAALGEIAPLRRINTQFTFAAPTEFRQGNIRVDPKLEPLGCLGDLGWYNVRLSLWAMDYALPEAVTGRILAEQSGVPMEFSGELLYPNGVSASFYCSFQTELQQWAHISGETGSLALEDFVLPFYGAEVGFSIDKPVFLQDGCTFHMRKHSQRRVVREYSEGMPSAQEVNMIRTFSDLALGGKVDPKWSEMALLTQRVLDACLKSGRTGGKEVSP